MKYHGIPNARQDDNKAGAAKDPEQATTNGRLHTGPVLPNRDPARERADISPKMARAAGRPAMGQKADPAVAAAGSAYFISAVKGSAWDGPQRRAEGRGNGGVQGRILPEGRQQGAGLDPGRHAPHS